MSYRKSAALLAALFSLAAGPVFAEIAIFNNGTAGAVTLEFEGRSYVLEASKGVEIELPPKSAPAKVTFADGASYTSTLDFAAVESSVEDYWGEGRFWCVSLAVKMAWVETVDECDWWVNG